jgi:hypothetical protein
VSTPTGEQYEVFDTTGLCVFLARVLSEEPVVDLVNELLLEHVVAGLYHRSVVARSLRALVDEALDVATDEDWQRCADLLIADARAVLDDGAAVTE